MKKLALCLYLVATATGICRPADPTASPVPAATAQLGHLRLYRGLRWYEKLDALQARFPNMKLMQDDSGAYFLEDKDGTFAGHKADVRLYIDAGELVKIAVLIETGLMQSPSEVLGVLTRALTLKYGAPVNSFNTTLFGVPIVSETWLLDDTVLDLKLQTFGGPTISKSEALVVYIPRRNAALEDF